MNTDDVDRRTVLPRARAGAANDAAAARDVSLVYCCRPRVCSNDVAVLRRPAHRKANQKRPGSGSKARMRLKGQAAAQRPGGGSKARKRLKRLAKIRRRTARSKPWLSRRFR